MSNERWLHLGCGKRVLPEAVHIDIGDFPHLDYCHDFRSLPMIESGTFDGVYASHCFEYIDRPDTVKVLREWKRVLKTNGILRIAVPDFEALCKVYSLTRDISKVIGPIFGRWDPNAGKSDVITSQNDHIVFHKYVYDEPSLTALLQEAGFNHIRRWDWREVFVGKWEGYDDYSQAYYPHMDKDNGILTSLNLEGIA